MSATTVTTGAGIGITALFSWMSDGSNVGSSWWSHPSPPTPPLEHVEHTCVWWHPTSDSNCQPPLTSVHRFHHPTQDDWNAARHCAKKDETTCVLAQEVDPTLVDGFWTYDAQTFDIKFYAYPEVMDNVIDVTTTRSTTPNVTLSVYEPTHTEAPVKMVMRRHVRVKHISSSAGYLIDEVLDGQASFCAQLYLASKSCAVT